MTRLRTVSSLPMVFVVAWIASQTLPLFGADNKAIVLLRLDEGGDLSGVSAQDAKVSLVGPSGKKALRIETGHQKRWPGVTIKAPAGKWDLSGRTSVSLDVRNKGEERVTVYCRVDNPGADGRQHCVTGSVRLEARQESPIVIPLLPKRGPESAPKIIGMRGTPVVSSNLDPSNVTQLLVFVSRPTTDHVFEVQNVLAMGTRDFEEKAVEAKDFFPMIDIYGQYIHREWPGKTHSRDELIAHGEKEKRDIARQPGPPDRNRHGGWTAGPQLEATGFFRTAKHKGKWWLVDPEGRLFWSHGIDCVRSGNATPIRDREHYYRDLPQAGSPLAQFYGRGSWAPHGYYKDHSPYRTYDFSQANLFRKYGESWREAFSEITHRRLKSWGINTIANWSDSAIYRMRKTPYVGTISCGAKRLEGSTGYWGKFYDVFDPDFRASLQRRCSHAKGRAAGDPWCIGFFVDNELGWGNEVSLAVAALKSPAEQVAKKVFIADLEAKYGTVSRLNDAWGTQHASWKSLLASTTPPDEKKARADLTAFYTKTAETYFRTIREELKKVAPQQLYLGCRFAWVNDRAARAAAKFCDVVCYNRYAYSVENQRLPDGLDKPIVIGEFHFGALDRGMFHTGLRKATGQRHRAQLYADYVRGALRNPWIVGTHWFQYKDQATTGRGDGENYQIGFIDICDKPYPEIVKAARDVGNAMYEYRLNAKR